MSFLNRTDVDNDNANADHGGLPPVNDDLMKLYHRIKYLHVQLGKEQCALKVAQRRLADLKETGQKEQTVNDQHRRHMLQCINARNNVELELFEVKDLIDTCKMTITKYSQETEDLERKLQDVQDESHRLIQTLYGPQQLQMELYLRALTETVQAKQDKMQKRNRRLAAIRTEMEESKDQEEAYKKATEKAKEEIVQLCIAASQGADEEKTVLRGQIQQILQEVSKRTKDVGSMFYFDRNVVAATSNVGSSF